MAKSRFALVTRATLGIGALALILTGTAQAQIAQITSPTPGTTLTGASVTFNWTTGTDVQQYYLYVGSILGSNDIYGMSQGTSTTTTVTNLPTNGSTVYLRLWSYVSVASASLSVGWHFNDYTYAALGSGSGGSGCSTPALATMSSPPPGTTLPGASVSFSWTAGCDITEYYLYVGTVLGSNDIYGISQGTSTTATVTNLPTNGSTIYLRLWSYVSVASASLSVGWHFNDYTYAAFGSGSGGSGCNTPALATMSNPPPGTTLPGASVSFSWTAGCDITEYYLYVGTVLGSNDIYGISQGTSTTATVTNLPTNGSTIYLRLWSYVSVASASLSVGWHFNDYTYAAFGSGSGGSGCSTPALATMSNPPPGTTLPGASVSFSWTAGCDITEYYLYVGTVLGSNDIYGISQGTSTTATVTNLPTNGSTVYLRLWSYVSVASASLSVGWHFNDYTYAAFGSGSGGSGCSTPALATMSSPPPGTTLPGASVSFSWTAGCDITQYYLYVGSVQGANDIFGMDPGTSTAATVTNLPTNGSTIYVRLWSYVSFASASLSVGWHFNDYTYITATTAPTVVSYQVLWGSQSFNVIGSARNRLPWQITGIRVVFSKPIASGSLNSLGGVVPTSFSGLGTNTLTWSISPIVLGSYATTLAGSGANALSDAAGNPLSGGAGFAQNVKVLDGDFNDDGAVNSLDLVGINNATVKPYNILADINGDGTVSAADALAARSRIGTSLP